jgi:hypothetical protein
MSRGFDFDSFEMDDSRESDSYDRGRETGVGMGGRSLSGASVRLQQQRLRIYTHASGSAQRDAVNLLEEQLFPSVPKLESCRNVAEKESQLIQ